MLLISLDFLDFLVFINPLSRIPVCIMYSSKRLGLGQGQGVSLPKLMHKSKSTITQPGITYMGRVIVTSVIASFICMWKHMKKGCGFQSISTENMVVCYGLSLSYSCI